MICERGVSVRETASADVCFSLSLEAFFLFQRVRLTAAGPQKPPTRFLLPERRRPRASLF